jgi:hypothetical protein
MNNYLSMRDASDFKKSDLTEFDGGDCFGDLLKFSGQRGLFVINEKLTPGIRIFADAIFWENNDKLRDYAYCAHIPEEELMGFLRRLGYTVTAPDDGAEATTEEA